MRSTYTPTPDDLALESLLDDLCRQFRAERDTEARLKIRAQYRELKAQQSPEFVAHLEHQNGTAATRRHVDAMVASS